MGTFTANCIGKEDCYHSTWDLDGISTLATFIAIGNQSLVGDIYAGSISGKLNILCNGAVSCYELTVYPPYYDTYKFNLYCAEQISSCKDIFINTPSNKVFETNYMSLDCPISDPNSVISTCDIHFNCDMDKTSYINLTYSSTNKQYECITSYNSDDTDETQWCCPWIDTNMIAPTKSTAADGVNSIHDHDHIVSVFVCLFILFFF